MQRRKRFIKGLSLLVVFVICGLLINNWFFKLNTMRLTELKKQAAQYVVQQYNACKNGKSQILLLLITLTWKIQRLLVRFWALVKMVQ